ncbi:hypothetical protein BVY01_01620, partial [bacterium I07]
MDIQQKLRNLDPSLTGMKKPVKRVSDVHIHIKGTEAETPAGNCFCAVTSYARGMLQGDVPIDGFKGVNPAVFEWVGKDPGLKDIDFENVLFVDTETTGLAGGTGTIPFMVGLGYFTESEFILEQYFMRDLHEESGLLHAVGERIRNSSALVTYNGKAYDFNILSSRFILSRLENPAAGLPHLDLLFTVRRIWRRRLPDCSLGRVESSLLGFQRFGDVPGYMIPGLYFNYLRTKNAGALKTVFDHNRWDILTLAALAGLCGKIYERPEDSLDEPLDLISLGRNFINISRLDLAARCLSKAVRFDLDDEIRHEALGFLGLVLKRRGEWKRAGSGWDEMCKLMAHSLCPYMELAKYYEHRTGDLSRAMKRVDSTIQR